MRRCKFIVANDVGLHARPAARLVECAQRFSCEVMLYARGSSCDAKSIFGVLGLDVACGTEVTVVLDGVDEEQAEEALALLAETL